MNLSSKQRAYLKKISNDIKPVVRIGKEGLNSKIIKSVNDAITKKELIKVKILENSSESKKEAAQVIADKTAAEIVQIIGRVIILFKENNKKPIISKLVKEI